MKTLVFAILFAALVALALPQPSDAQGVKGMTLDQYLLMQERVDAFCSYFASGQPFPAAGQGLRIATGGQNGKGTSLYYVFSQTEVQALIRHCQNLVGLMAKASGADDAAAKKREEEVRRVFERWQQEQNQKK